jgi:hypothetical protein
MKYSIEKPIFSKVFTARIYFSVLDNWRWIWHGPGIG